MVAEANTVINSELLNSAMSYDEYMKLITELFEQGKTTGDNQSESMLGYAKMNLQRMKRLTKTVQLNEDLEQVLSNSKTKMIWLVLTEGWCGDAAQNIPVFYAISKAYPNIELKLILRDENLAIMDQFLTNGGRSIPKLIALNHETLEVKGTWGPRPAVAQKMVNDFKKIPNGDYSEFVKEVQLWYAKDKTNQVQKELKVLLEEWN